MPLRETPATMHNNNNKTMAKFRQAKRDNTVDDR